MVQFDRIKLYHYPGMRQAIPHAVVAVFLSLDLDATIVIRETTVGFLPDGEPSLY
jgi:hypothetical protein